MEESTQPEEPEAGQGTGIATTKAENPLWWPQAAAAAFNPRTFGGKTLPKSSKLPKAGSAFQQGAGSLYDGGTLTCSVAAVCSPLPHLCCSPTCLVVRPQNRNARVPCISL